MVNVNDTLGIRLGLDYLHHLGHRRIAFLHSPQWSQEVERSRIFQETLAAFGLTMPPAYLATMQDVAYDPAAPNFQEMWTVQPLRAAQALLQLPERPTAIFCANDGFALACLKGARQLGVRVPDDLSILGYNDELTATLYYPELTTIHQPLDRIAEVALDMLLKMIEAGENGGAAGERILVDPALVMRGTCAVPPASR
jgi:LacI family transcriptional regulator